MATFFLTTWTPLVFEALHFDVGGEGRLIAGPWLAGIILSTSLPVGNIFAILAICPAVVLICVFLIGRIHTRLLRERALWKCSEPS